MKRRDNQLICRINGTPILAVLLVLRVAVVSPNMTIIDLPKGTVDLADAEHSVPLPGARREDALRVSISRSGDISFRNQGVAIDELASKLQEGMYI
jgi:biopolymer transport protein ExbD